MVKCHRKHKFPINLISLDSDILACILEALGLHGINLRQTCKTFAHLRLPEGAALALKVLQVGPSIPLVMHVPRRTTRACTFAKWDYFAYRASLIWRLEWALALKDIDSTPIQVLIDAYGAIPPGETSVFGAVWVGEQAVLRQAKETKKACEYVDAKDDGFRVKGSDYTSHARIALYKAIEARVWDIIWGDDLKRPMCEGEIVAVMKRIFKCTPVRNDKCFHFTSRGFLKYTPLLLAAEKHNLPLVKYLMGRCDTDTNACSAGGNNAYAICEHALRRLGLPEGEVSNSTVLSHLKTKCGCYQRVYREEGRG